ncbi:MAG: prepilin-type N-terminal cleavage/methylation domain-containing protein [bacterium]
MKRNRSGFSMIEVLVASTIMMMMVMMLGMLFQQTSFAWRTGKQRADTYQQVRALFGSMQRDASAAIDQGSLPQTLFLGNRKMPKVEDQNFNGSTLSFYTLTGTGFDNDDDARSGQAPRRAITLVKYSGNGQRSVTTFLAVGTGGFSIGTPQDGAIVNPNLNGAQVQLTGIKAYDEKGNSASGTKFPAYVTVSAGVNSEGVRSFDVGAGSGGPDRTLGKSAEDIRSRDDIKTWVE